MSFFLAIGVTPGEMALIGFNGERRLTNSYSDEFDDYMRNRIAHTNPLLERFSELTFLIYKN